MESRNARELTQEQKDSVDKMMDALMGAPTEPSPNCSDGADHDFESIMHADGSDSYTWLFKCEKCGEYVKIVTQRTGEDKEYWA